MNDATGTTERHRIQRASTDEEELFRRTTDLALAFLGTLPDRPVRSQASLPQLREALGGPLPDRGERPLRVIEELASNADPGIIASAGPRYFGFVIGGATPVSIAADWLTSAWDQNAGAYSIGPAHAVAEETAARWLLEIFGLPASASVGLTTGAQMANFAGLAAGRRAVLLARGWDVERDGLQGAPPVTVVAGAAAHVTIEIAVQMLGLGTGRVLRADADDQGRMRPEALRAVLASVSGPVIVCAQAGNVNSGAFDPLDEVAAIVRERDAAWLHVDGAFGLWAAASSAYRHLLRGVEQADSWSCDSHKWLNVPYDSGIVAVRDAAVHRAAMMLQAAYLMPATGDERDPSDYVPEFSRRGRGFAVYASLRALGREGVADLVERCCAVARRMAERLAAEDGVSILNDIVLNQVLVRFSDDDATTRAVITAVQEDGTCWLAGTTWRGKAAMRISVSNWSTTERDGDLSVDAIVRCFRSVRSG